MHNAHVVNNTAGDLFLEKSKRFLRFSDDEDMKKDSVEDIKWDPLSDDYFISINKLSGESSSRSQIEVILTYVPHSN